MNLKRIGFYCEMPHGKENDPSIKDCISSIEISGKKEICNYLNNGIMLAACFGMETDVINPDAGFSGCPCYLTDGTWVWPGDLIYYVEKYNLQLPKEFLDFMEGNNYLMSIKEEDIRNTSITIEGENFQ